MKRIWILLAVILFLLIIVATILIFFLDKEQSNNSSNQAQNQQNDMLIVTDNSSFGVDGTLNSVEKNKDRVEISFSPSVKKKKLNIIVFDKSAAPLFFIALSKGKDDLSNEAQHSEILRDNESIYQNLTKYKDKDVELFFRTMSPPRGKEFIACNKKLLEYLKAGTDSLFCAPYATKITVYDN